MLRWIVTWGLAVLLVVALPGTALAAPAVTLSSSTGPPTTTLTVSGTGFAASSLVDVYWDLTQVAFGSTTSTGAMNPMTITVPASATPGTHQVTIKNDGA